MAQLRLGTTIGGYAAYHAGNLPVYGKRWPSAAEAGALAITGGTTTGSIRATYLQAGLPANAWKAMMGASETANEGIFGVSSDGTGAWHSYLRIGRTLFQYNNGVSNYDVYHSGRTIPWDKISGGSTTTIAGAGSTGSHASITISGAKNGYAGIHFSTPGNTLMMSDDVQGVYGSAGWSWYFSKGVLTVGSVPWARLTGIPSTFKPSAHTHDDRYFTEAEADGRFLGKTATATNSTNLNGVAATGYARAYSGSYTFGGNANAITTAQFLDLLAAHGAFASPVWIARGSWNYAGNQVISDTGVGNIHLAGAVIEVVGTSSGNCTIRIHQPTTTGSGTPGGDYIYVNNGPTYSPGWRKLYNTMHPPSYLDVGALPAGGTAVNSAKLGGYAPSTSWTANTIVLRNASADIDARLFRSSYANQDNISGAIAFRVNNSSDPYIRFCSSPAAVRAWLGAQAAGSYAAASHTHAYAPLTGTGTSGTWPISITGSSASTRGNAATATNIANSGAVTLGSATESNSISITQPSFSQGKPVKLLNFDWYGDKWSLGNIRSGSTPSEGLGVYFKDVEKFRFTNGSFQIGSNTALHSGNYNSYAPTKTGGGASGTWGISVSGNAGTATKWVTGRTLTIGNKGKSVDGSANVTWSLAEIGAQPAGSYAAASHTHAGYDIKALGNRISIGAEGEIYANNNGYRQAGMYGIYESSKVGHIWSMGTAYKVNAAGTNFGSLYGLAYKHTTNTTGGTMAGGHQAVWCQNGVPKCAFGDNIWSAGNVTAYSDARVKFDIEPISNPTERLMKVNGYTYRRSDIEEAAKASAKATGEPLAAPKRYAGVIAQEFLEVLPEVVTGGPTENDPDGHYSVDYGNIVALLIEGFKEQQRKIEDLERLCQTLQQATR